MSDRINPYSAIYQPQPQPPISGPPPAANVAFFSPDAQPGTAAATVGSPTATTPGAGGNAGNSSDVASTFQQLPASLQSLLVQLQSDLNNVGGNDPAGADGAGSAAENTAGTTGDPTTSAASGSSGAASPAATTASASSDPAAGDDQPSLTSVTLFAQDFLSAVQSYAASAANLGSTAAGIAAIA